MKIKKSSLKINPITFLFLSAIVCKFGNHSMWFMITVLGLLLLELITCPKTCMRYIGNVILQNRLLLFAYFISIATTICSTLIRQELSINYIYELILFGFLVLLGILFGSFKNKDLISGLKQIIVIMSILSMLGIVEFLTHDNIFVKFGFFSDYYLKGNTRVTTAFINPMIYASALLFAIITTIFVYEKSLKRNIILVLLGINFLLTQTRSSWLAMFALLLVFLVRFIIKNKTRFKKHTLLYLLLFIPLVFYALQRFGFLELVIGRFSEIGTYDIKGYQRTGTIMYVLSLFFSSNMFYQLFGHGNHSIGIGMLNTTIQWQNFSTTDNLWIADLYNFGIIYVCIAIFTAIRFFIVSISTNNRYLLMSIIAMLAMEINFFFLEPFNYYTNAMMFFFNFGCLLAFDFKEKYRLQSKEV